MRKEIKESPDFTSGANEKKRINLNYTFIVLGDI